MNLILWIITGLTCGSLISFLLFKYFDFAEKKRTQLEAKEIVDKSRDQLEILEMDQKDQLLSIEEELWGKAEPELFKLEEKIENLEGLEQEKKQNLEKLSQKLKNDLAPKTKSLNEFDAKVLREQSLFNEKKQKFDDLKEKWVAALCQKLNTQKEGFTSTLKQEFIQGANSDSSKFLQSFEDELQITLESRAKRILSTVTDRFVRPYCPERGHGAVPFPDENVKRLFLDTEGKNVKAITAACGCDLVFDLRSSHDEPNSTPSNRNHEFPESVGIAGYDPVRRELTRRTLEKVFKERKSITPELIKRRAEDVQRELFRQIRQDGDAIAKELRLEGLHPEIRQMMGALRYRYSFTQNQYFHCGEVGWLCGLLSSELNLDIKKGRRAGMLHDIGKSMDHAIEGGHAVIGADFIKTRNESAEIVHAVRAHHFDEQPSTELAYLVIAADAISGARPGARRSTVESYNQKVEELETIAKSFKGVTEAYILSGGREVRVLTNGKLVDDSKAVEISREIALRIEQEVNYPGQIKVVVVRSTHAQESTWAHSS